MGRIGKLYSVFFLLLSACATSDAMRQYPRAQIDRPYALPEGMGVWKTTSVYAQVEDSGQPLSSQLVVFPFSWENGVSKVFTLEWSPLPTGFRYLIHEGPEFWLGTAFSLLGSPLYQFQDFNFTPVIQLDYRRKLGRQIALNSSFSYQMELRRSSEAFHSIMAAKLGGLCQITESIALEPYLSLNFERGTPRTGYFVSPSIAGSSVRVPLGLRASWFALDQWEFSSDYRYLRLNYPGDYQSHQIFLSTHYFF